MSRPEHIAPPEIYYNDDEAKKYTSNSHIMEVQANMTERALELLNLPDDDIPRYLLDIGCGSGLSTAILEEAGHSVVGVDISPSMINVALERKDVEADMLLWDIGQGFSFRPGTFDGAISISVIQWLCNADKTCNNPVKRINKFFQSLYNSLVRGGRAVFQLYPETPQQLELLTNAAQRAGFGGGLVVDFPNSTRAKKYFLVLWAGTTTLNPTPALPKAVDDVTSDQVVYENQRERDRDRQKRKKREAVTGRNWVLEKKERYRKQGKEVRPDSKYTGRKRRPKGG